MTQIFYYPESLSESGFTGFKNLQDGRKYYCSIILDFMIGS